MVDIQKLNKFKKKNNKWCSSGFIKEVQYLLSKYPNKTTTIMKAMNISKSTYYRHFYNDEKEETKKLEKRRRHREMLKLSEPEIEIVRQMVLPPKYPTTINEI